MFYLLNYSRIWWALLDSNQGSREATDLQSARFDRLPKYPNTAVVVVTTIETLQTTPLVLYTLMVYGNKLPNIIFAKGRYRFALLVRKVGLEPTRVIHSQDFKSCASNSSAISPYKVHKVPNLHTTIIFKCYGSLGAQRRSRTFKHWFLRPAALPVCIFVHIRSGATIVLYDTNSARRRVCTN